MSIVIGNTSTDGEDSGSTNHSWSHNNDGNFLIVCFGSRDDTAARYATGVTYDGDALTRAVRTNIQQGGAGGVWHTAEIWYKINPSTGANNIVASYAAIQDRWGGGAGSFNGVITASPVDDTDVDAGTAQVVNKEVTLVAQKANSLMVDMHEVDAGSLGNPPGRTKVFEVNGNQSYQMSYLTGVALGSDDYTSGDAPGNDYQAYAGALFNSSPVGNRGYIIG